MKSPLFRFSLIIAVLLFSSNAYCISFKWRYIPVDSITETYLKRKVSLDFKVKEKTFEINGEKYTFDVAKDSIVGSAYYLTHYNEKLNIGIKMERILAMDNDSIYVSAYSETFDKKKGHNKGKSHKIDRIAIAKNELRGIAVLPPDKQMNKMLWFISGLSVISVLSALVAN